MQMFTALPGAPTDFIVGRPCCAGNVPCPLPNTTEITFNGGMAETGNSTVFYPGSQASSTEILTMTDDGGDQDIEVLSGQGSSGYQGQHSLWFTEVGVKPLPSGMGIEADDFACVRLLCVA
jgi:hypothetical protein